MPVRVEVITISSLGLLGTGSDQGCFSAELITVTQKEIKKKKDLDSHCSYQVMLRKPRFIFSFLGEGPNFA